MSNGNETPNLPIGAMVGAALSKSTVITSHDNNEHERMDGILRAVDRNLAQLTERVTHVQNSVDRLTTKLDKIDSELITKEDHAMIKRWLTGTTIGLVVTAIIACIALAGVVAIVVYLSGLSPTPGMLPPLF